MKVSIVIPAYNASNTIARALWSIVLNGSIVSEVIIVDNNCTDDTIIKASAFKNLLPIRILKEERSGASFARNTGLKAVNNQIIQFLDADDELLSGKLIRQYQYFDDESIGFVVGSFIVKTPHQENLIQIDTLKSVLLNLFEGHLGITSSNLWRKSAVENVGGWRETLQSSQEADLMFRLIKAEYKVAIMEEALTVIHYDAAQRISTSNEKENAKRFALLRKQMLIWLVEEKSEEFLNDRQAFYLSYYKSISALYKFNRSEGKKLLKSEYVEFAKFLDISDFLKLTIKLLS